MDAAVRLWPPCRSSDANRAGAHGTGGLDLRTTVSQWVPTTSNGGNPPPWQLNPRFVEALMGFHSGWTAFAPSETPSCLSVPPQPSAFSLIAP